MKKELWDVFHLYYGCEVMFVGGNEYFFKNGDIYTIDHHIFYKMAKDFEDFNFENYKLILRKMTDITDEERNIASNLSGLVALGTANIGDKNLIYSEAEHIAYLLKQGFDLFGLIESGQAIDKTTLKK